MAVPSFSLPFICLCSNYSAEADGMLCCDVYVVSFHDFSLLTGCRYRGGSVDGKVYEVFLETEDVGGWGSSPTRMSGLIFVISCIEGLKRGRRWDPRGGTHSGQLLGCIHVMFRICWFFLLFIVFFSHVTFIALSCPPLTRFGNKRMGHVVIADRSPHRIPW